MVLTRPRFRLACMACMVVMGSSAFAAGDGTVSRGHFFSRALGVEKSYFIYLPASYATDAERHYPVVYLLHGSGNTESEWISNGSIDRTADALMVNGGVPEMILVMPDGDDGFYFNWHDSPDFGACRDDPRRIEVAHCVHSARYGDYIASDLPQEVDSKYRTLADPAHRAVAGLSMGGYGSMYLGVAYPGVFKAIASLSAATILFAGPHPYRPPARYWDSLEATRKDTPKEFWPTALAMLGTSFENWRSHELAFAYEDAVKRHQLLPAIYMMVGTDDDLQLQDANRALHDRLVVLGVEHEYHEWRGHHEWAFWGPHEPELLRWLGAQIGPAAQAAGH